MYFLVRTHFLLLGFLLLCNINCDNKDYPKHYNISPGTYSNDSLQLIAIISDSLVLFYEKGALIDSLNIKSQSYLESDPTNDGFASVYQYFRLDIGSITLSLLFRNPGIIATTWMINPSDSFGNGKIILSSDSLIQNCRNYLANYEGNAILFVKKYY